MKIYSMDQRQDFQVTYGRWQPPPPTLLITPHTVSEQNTGRDPKKVFLDVTTAETACDFQILLSSVLNTLPDFKGKSLGNEIEC